MQSGPQSLAWPCQVASVGKTSDLVKLLAFAPDSHIASRVTTTHHSAASEACGTFDRC